MRVRSGGGGSNHDDGPPSQPFYSTALAIVLAVIMTALFAAVVLLAGTLFFGPLTMGGMMNRLPPDPCGWALACVMRQQLLPQASREPDWPRHPGWRQLSGMDRDELLARSKHYRALADRVTDEQTRQGLLDLAERYEALALGDEGLDDDLLDRDL